MKEEITNQTIESYIDKLIASYGLYPPINEQGLKIQFEHKLYAECVLSVMQYFKLMNKVKVRCFADHLYPCKNSFARVHIPGVVPIYGTDQFRQIKIDVDMKESAKSHFYAFIRSLSHELAHIILHSTKHSLYKSEVATDLCILVFGFSDFVRKGSVYKLTKGENSYRGLIGYLDEDQIRHATRYIESLRKTAPPPKTMVAKIVDSIMNFVNDLFN